MINNCVIVQKGQLKVNLKKNVNSEIDFLTHELVSGLWVYLNFSIKAASPFNMYIQIKKKMLKAFL